ncbi:MAG TPA: 5'/3'-nucleotidase SurE [Acidimicrobiales bacterium]|jgi:5'-nucleotidase|nr:5'/3'-nucleotidase SurE [Acidimicrobiales bacterium]
MKVLVTNDDGVASPGLHALARALVDDGHDVIVVAPDREMSGSAAAIGQVHVESGIDAKRIDLPRLDGVPAYAVAGPPGLCVLTARLGGFGDPPDLIVSGINPGCNTGRAVLHSGTVGAALTAANFGCRGLAVSIDVSTLHLHEQFRGTVTVGDGDEARAEVVESVEIGDDPGARGRLRDVSGVAFDRPAEWDTAATVAASAVGWLAEAPPCTVLNLNVPNVALDRLGGARSATLAPFGTVRSSVVEAAPDGGRLQIEFRPTDQELPPESDTAIVAQGFVSVTALSGIGVDDRVDVSGVLELVPTEDRRTA